MNGMTALGQDIGQEGGIFDAKRLAVKAKLFRFEIDRGVFDGFPRRAIASPSFDADVGVIDDAVAHRA